MWWLISTGARPIPSVVFFAPGVFQLHGEEALWYDPAPDEAQREQVLRAAVACPVQAIFVEWSEAANRKNTEEPHE